MSARHPSQPRGSGTPSAPSAADLAIVVGLVDFEFKRAGEGHSAAFHHIWMEGPCAHGFEDGLTGLRGRIRIKQQVAHLSVLSHPYAHFNVTLQVSIDSLPHGSVGLLAQHGEVWLDAFRRSE